MHADCGWRTRLGTCFYDRSAEVRLLENLVSNNLCIILYGPRNVGKSELARYVAGRKRLPGIIVDARRARVEATGPLRPPASTARLIARRVGLDGLLEEALRILAGIATGVIVVDEFHLIGGIGDLEAVCKLVQLGEYGASIVATVSEGRVTLGMHERLAGYAHIMPVEHLDEHHMRGVYDEYARRRGCKPGFRCVWGLVGGSPGYLQLLCPLDREGLELWLDGLLRIFWEAVLEAEERLRLRRNELLGTVYRLFTGGPPGSHEELALAKLLVEHNIAYPARGGVYRPQLPVYLQAARLALETGWPTASKLLEELCPDVQ